MWVFEFFCTTQDHQMLILLCHDNMRWGIFSDDIEFIFCWPYTDGHVAKTWELSASPLRLPYKKLNFYLQFFLQFSEPNQHRTRLCELIYTCIMLILWPSFLGALHSLRYSVYLPSTGFPESSEEEFYGDPPILGWLTFYDQYKV